MTNSASSHWSAQRLSAIGLIFLSAFSFYRIFGFIGSGQPLVNIFSMPFFLMALVLFIVMGLYHSYLGIEVILEDYVVCGIKRRVIGGAVKLVNFATIALIIMTMFHGYSKISSEEIVDNNIESAEVSDKKPEKLTLKEDTPIKEAPNKENTQKTKPFATKTHGDKKVVKPKKE